jgi:WD40 repeat protein
MRKEFRMIRVLVFVLPFIISGCLPGKISSTTLTPARTMMSSAAITSSHSTTRDPSIPFGIEVILDQDAEKYLSINWANIYPEEWWPVMGGTPRYALRITTSWIGQRSCPYRDTSEKKFVFLQKRFVVNLELSDLISGIMIDQRKLYSPELGECPSFIFDFVDPPGFTSFPNYSDLLQLIWEITNSANVDLPNVVRDDGTSVPLEPTPSLLPPTATHGPVKADFTYDNITIPADFIELSPDGTILVWGSTSKMAFVNLVESGTPKPMAIVHSDKINAVSFSPDSTIIASSSDDGSVVLWKSQSGLLIRRLQEKQDPNKLIFIHEMTSVAFSPDGKILAAGTIRGQIIFWDTGTGSQLKNLDTTLNTSIVALAFSSDGNYLAAGGLGDSVLFDLENEKVIRTWHNSFIANEIDAIKAISFSPDGLTLTTLGMSSRIHFWNVQNGDLLSMPLDSDKDKILSFSYSVDGTMIAVLNGDGKTIRLCDSKNGNVLQTFYGYTDADNIYFSSDGNALFLVASGNKKIQVWRIAIP